MRKLLVLTLVCGFCGALGDVLRISNETDFINFIETVNSGVGYSEAMVLLDNDLDFSEFSFDQLEPIGISIYAYFTGVFDGQGHVIRNFEAKYNSLRYVGLFGYSAGAAIRNIVVDSSCSITSFNHSWSTYVGGIIGKCEAEEMPCQIENTVNMATITFYDDYYFYAGGIAGAISAENGYTSAVRNNANYGNILHLSSDEYDGGKITPKAGSGVSYSSIGGIIGYYSGAPDSQINNNLNYGTINSTVEFVGVDEMYIGGIIGYTIFSTIDNCVNFGSIHYSFKDALVGSVAGFFEVSKVSHCYWNKELDFVGIGNEFDSAVVGCSGFDAKSFDLNNDVSVGTYTGKSLLSALNAASGLYHNCDYSSWILNKGKKNVKFVINDGEFTMGYELILAPSLANLMNITFDGWYEDSSYTAKMKKYAIEQDTVLYGKWSGNSDSYTITFDTRGGTYIQPITARPGEFIELPYNTTKEGYELLRWDTENGETVFWELTMPSHDLNLIAVWVCGYITTPEQFIELSNVMNTGTNSDKVYVYLDADLDFEGLSDKFVPIGNGWDKHFFGHFDGQGHTISNLVINSTEKFVGLFGYVERSEITNIVLDSSCSVTSTRKTSSEHEGIVSGVGGFIGFSCETRVEGLVNMAPIEFSGEGLNHDSYLGGITGFSDYGEPEMCTKYCMNFGTVTYSGSSGSSFVGGITNAIDTFVEYSANYGTIVYSGKADEAYVGGICGESYFYSAWIEACISGGSIVKKESSNVVAGGIVGLNENHRIADCIWTSNVGASNPVGLNDSMFEMENVNLVEELDKDMIDEMNMIRAGRLGWMKWVIMYLDGGEVNGVSQDPVVVTEWYFPTPAKRGYRFKYLCTSENCTEIYNPLTSNITEITELYAQWEQEYTVFFDLGNGTVLEIHLLNNETINYPPDPVREGYGFVGWDVNVSIMAQVNVTVKAKWVENPTEFVEIVFGTSDLTEEQLKEVISQYTSEKFTIEEFDVDKETGETRVIIKFEDKTGAIKFMRTVNDIVRDDPNSMFRKAESVERKPSFSLGLLPNMLLSFVF